MSNPLQIGSVDLIREATMQLVGLGLAAAVVATVGAIVFRHRTTRPLPTGAGPFVGVSIVAGWLLAELVVNGSLIGAAPYNHAGTGVYAVTGLGLGTVLGGAGSRFGDRIVCAIYSLERLHVGSDMADLLRSARVLTMLTIPDHVEDAAGYSPVDGETKRAIAGTACGLPDRLSEAELLDRLENRIVTDFDVDHASVTLDDGVVESVSVGQNRTGLGPTLPPGTVGVAVEAVPGDDASPGDPVEIWETDSELNLLATGRFRSKTGAVATVVVDRDDTAAFDPTARYRLVTPSETPSDHYRLASLLRSVDETTIVVPVTDDDLAGEFVGWLPGAVLALEREETVLTVPDDRETLQAGDTVFLVGHPTAFAEHEGLKNTRIADV